MNETSGSGSNEAQRGAAHTHGDLDFPDAPRLKLDALLAQLSEQSRKVLSAQGRLRALLRANAVIVSDLTPNVVLRHIVESARSLVRARYAALAVIGHDGRIAEFIHDGMDEETARLIGKAPEGRGILGLLIDDPRPLRLADLSQHPAASGFPPNYPPMHSFLGVPIYVRNRRFANLYLTESANGEFSADDQQLIVALASTAGMAIENASLYSETEQRRRWQTASTELVIQLLSGEDDAPLQAVASRAVEAIAADFAGVILPSDEGYLRIAAAAGPLAAVASEHPIDMEESASAQVMLSGKPLLLENDEAARSTAEFPAGLEHLLIVPVRLDAGALGALGIGRLAGRASFTDADLEQLSDFASHAWLALTLDRARAARETLRILDDHDRIATDLHGQVIQELFAVGLGLQGMVRWLDRPEWQERVISYVERIDATVRHIRDTVFDLQHRPPIRQSVRQQLFAAVESTAAEYGLEPAIEFAGPLESTVPTQLCDDLTDAVRDTLTGWARHVTPGATPRVRVEVNDDLVTLSVSGEDVGAPIEPEMLASLQRQARAHDGQAEIETMPGDGTRLCWTARVGQPASASAS